MIKDTNLIFKDGLLIGLGFSFLIVGIYFGTPAMILFIISGVLILKENRSLSVIKKKR